MTGLSDQALRQLAWASWWVVAATAAVGRVVTSIGDPETPASWGSSLLGEYGFTVVVVAFPLVGLGILARQPRNRIGWLLMGVGLSWAVPGLLDAYAHYGLVIEPGSVPGPAVVAALNEGTWAWGIVLMGVYLVLLFPDGHLVSPPWRWVAWVGGVAALLVPIGITLSPGELEEAPVAGLVSPLSVEALEPLALVLSAVGLPLVPLSILASAVSLAVRFRRSLGIEREQIKWLATAGALVAALFAVTLTATLLAEVASGGSPGLQPLSVRVLQEASLLSFLLLPLAIGAAILRYRLFDIDLVINRALVYVVLTVALAALYLGSVLLLQLLLRPLTNESDLAVAGSTLAVAAVFRPARRQVQETVDRRFYRRRYDAALTLAAFTDRLRHQVDVDAVGVELIAAVRETVQPAHASVWLRHDRRLS